jgi:hypothetical protein
MNVIITMTPEDAQELGAVFNAYAVWPWIVYCGCKSGTSIALCAGGGSDCLQHRPCPSGYTGSCGFYFVFAPWYGSPPSGPAFPEQPLSPPIP